MRSSLVRYRRWILAVATGGAFVLSGCDPNVRNTVLSGVEGATTTILTAFVQAFFQSLNDDNDNTPTTVQATFELTQPVG